MRLPLEARACSKTGAIASAFGARVPYDGFDVVAVWLADVCGVVAGAVGAYARRSVVNPASLQRGAVEALDSRAVRRLEPRCSPDVGGPSALTYSSSTQKWSEASPLSS
jgi:hypothetical protein